VLALWKGRQHNATPLSTIQRGVAEVWAETLKAGAWAHTHPPLSFNLRHLRRLSRLPLKLPCRILQKNAQVEVESGRV